MTGRTEACSQLQDGDGHWGPKPQRDMYKRENGSLRGKNRGASTPSAHLARGCLVYEVSHYRRLSYCTDTWDANESLYGTKM